MHVLIRLACYSELVINRVNKSIIATSCKHLGSNDLTRHETVCTTNTKLSLRLFVAMVDCLVLRRAVINITINHYRNVGIDMKMHPWMVIE
jgi:hypothetical protein